MRERYGKYYSLLMSLFISFPFACLFACDHHEHDKMALTYFIVLKLLFVDFNGGVSVKNEKTGATELCMV